MKKYKGFTFVELLVIIAIVTILFVIMFNTFNLDKTSEEYKKDIISKKIEVLKNNIESYNLKYLHYPENIDWGNDNGNTNGS